MSCEECGHYTQHDPWSGVCSTCLWNGGPCDGGAEDMDMADDQ